MTVKGLDVVKKRMKSLLSEVKSSPESMTKIGLLGLRDIQLHFRNSQGPTSQWLPLKHRNGKPLLDTGLLSNSTRFKVKKNDVLLFNNTRYGQYHQYGSSKGFIPQRKWMWISEPARKKMAKTYARIIVGAF